MNSAPALPDIAQVPEKQCARCKEWWPADTEFFYRKGDGLHSYCRACFLERRGELRAGAPRKIERGSKIELPWWLLIGGENERDNALPH